MLKNRLSMCGFQVMSCLLSFCTEFISSGIFFSSRLAPLSLLPSPPLHLLGALAVQKQKTFLAQSLAVSECKCRSGLIYVACLISRRGEQDEGPGKAGELGLTFILCFCRQPTSPWCQNSPSTTYILMTFLSTLTP